VAPRFDRPALLTQTHDVSGFNSGENVLDDWLRKRAWNNLVAETSRTYVVCPTGTATVVGYYALSMGQLLATETPGSMRRNMPKFIPAVMLGRLAIDRDWQGMGIGRALLADVAARALRATQEVAARLLIVHAISQTAENFYLHHGFTRLPLDAPTLALDLVRFQKLGTSI